MELLRDSVDSGASIGFLAPLPAQDGREFCAPCAASLRPAACCWARTWMESSSARHRAEVQKLLVLQAFRGRGIAKALMAALERKAAELGRWLLVLDTVPRQPAEKLYEHLGYIRAGVVPDYAESSSGAFDPTVIFYKRLA
ncbi:MAG TPA: GNAT family N-acetyltransferase [Burkholderiales bacterium]